jgi:hypothetical protein
MYYILLHLKSSESDPISRQYPCTVGHNWWRELGAIGGEHQVKQGAYCLLGLYRVQQWIRWLLRVGNSIQIWAIFSCVVEGRLDESTGILEFHFYIIYKDTRRVLEQTIQGADPFIFNIFRILPLVKHLSFGTEFIFYHSSSILFTTLFNFIGYISLIYSGNKRKNFWKKIIPPWGLIQYIRY